MSEPLVGYHIQNAAGLFMCDDKHADRTWFGAFDDVFCCRWWNPADARRWMKPGYMMRVPVDGKLV